jgi:hypothetical protein
MILKYCLKYNANVLSCWFLVLCFGFLMRGRIESVHVHVRFYNKLKMNYK